MPIEAGFFTFDKVNEKADSVPFATHQDELEEVLVQYLASVKDRIRHHGKRQISLFLSL